MPCKHTVKDDERLLQQYVLEQLDDERRQRVAIGLKPLNYGDVLWIYDPVQNRNVSIRVDSIDLETLTEADYVKYIIVPMLTALYGISYASRRP